MTEAEIGDVDNPYRYSTKEWEEKSGLYYFGARYYSPEIGRCMTVPQHQMTKACRRVRPAPSSNRTPATHDRKGVSTTHGFS